jgi:hypothetical protein
MGYVFVFRSVSALSLVPAKLDAVTANARAWCHSGVRCAAPLGSARAGKTTPVKIESGVTVGGSLARNARKLMLSFPSQGIGNCERGWASGRLSSSNGQWFGGVSKALDVARAAIPNFSTRHSQFSSVISLIVGFPNGFLTAFGIIVVS